MNDNTTTAPVAPLLLSAAQAAAMLGISRTSFYGLLSAGRVPAPVFRAGRIVRWDRGELEAFVAAGCPSRDRWKVIRGETP